MLPDGISKAEVLGISKAEGRFHMKGRDLWAASKKIFLTIFVSSWSSSFLGNSGSGGGEQQLLGVWDGHWALPVGRKGTIKLSATWRRVAARAAEQPSQLCFAIA